ncbi:MAG: endonuclease/exonuclease/phosphatase family protein [Patescibacteria group bacterium]
MRLRIVVANIQSGIQVTKGYRQYLTSGWRYLLPHSGRGAMSAGTFLKAEDADIALLTEVDPGSKRSRGISQLEVMAAESGLIESRYFATRATASISEGNAVLTRFPILASQAYPLASSVNPRVLGETVLDLDGMRITVLVAHLALGSRPREAQIRQIAEIVKGIDGPCMLGGDFNERDHASFKALKKAGLSEVSVAGYPSWKPVHALQVLFLSHHFGKADASVPEGARFSDHLPLIVETELEREL